jgi:hypothetical protein
MAGVAGANIANAAGRPLVNGTPWSAAVVQLPIGLTKATTDGTTSARGCTTNFIGYGFGATSAEPLPNDFNATDDTVIRSTTVPENGIPTYTAIAGNTTHQTLSWAALVEDPEPE